LFASLLCDEEDAAVEIGLNRGILPSSRCFQEEDMRMPKPMVTIENWAVVKGGSRVAYEQLQPGNILTGKVYGHDRMPDAQPIYTSAIISIDLPTRVVETRNTLYRLGQVSEDYRKSDEYTTWERENRESQAA
jgi:hypothetical protein